MNIVSRLLLRRRIDQAEALQHRWLTDDHQQRLRVLDDRRLDKIDVNCPLKK